MRMNVPRFVSLGACCVLAGLFCELVLAQIRSPYDAPGSAVVDKPKPTAFASGSCVRVSDGSLLGHWVNRNGTFLKFTIGPFRDGLIDRATPYSKAPYTGPGKYTDVLVVFSLPGRGPGNWVIGRSTVTVNQGGQHGRFDFDDGSSAGSWDCGRDAKTRNSDTDKENASHALSTSSTGPYWDQGLFRPRGGAGVSPEIARMIENIRSLDLAGAKYLSCEYGPSGSGLGPLHFWHGRVMISMSEAAAISRYHKLLPLGDRAHRQCPPTYGEALDEARRNNVKAEAVVKQLYPR